MGTRGLTVVLDSEGEIRVAQYGQWDHYFEGQGKTVYKFAFEHLATSEGRAKFDEKVKRCEFFSSNDDENSFFDNRDLGGKILEEIWQTDLNPIKLVNSFMFGHDSLFCEYAYVVDLKREVFDVYVGFTKPEDKITGLWAELTEYVLLRALPSSGRNGYGSVTRVISFDLNRLPIDADDFVRKTVEADAKVRWGRYTDDQ